MKEITCDQALARRWDVVLIGSSFASMFFLRYLPTHLSVLVIEKGIIQNHSDQVLKGISGKEKFRQNNHSSLEKEWISHTKFGGNSNCWWACTPRFHPNDFKIKSNFNVGKDWPISYSDVEEAYCDIEEDMDIAGEERKSIFPRSRAFPSPPHAASRSDTLLQSYSEMWLPQPTARSNGRKRPKCCNNGVCHCCPIDSKFTILNSMHLFERENCFFVVGVEARAVRIENKIAKSVLVRKSNGHESEVFGSLIALGANAIWNAAILLRSGLNSPALGRYLHEQTSQYLIVDIDKPNYFGGTSITGHGYHFYDGLHRADSASVLIENFNNPFSLRPEPGRWSHRLRLKLIAEDLPNPKNRIWLKNGEAHIDWHGHSDYARAGLANARLNITKALPFSVEAVQVKPFAPTEAHIQGTTRMGNESADSVVDRQLRCHEAHNLLALGAGAFPSCSAANPTLTLSALSVIAARALQ